MLQTKSVMRRLPRPPAVDAVRYGTYDLQRPRRVDGMAYVPGLAHDIFLSYAHGDNETGWVTYFETRLRQRLREKLGFTPAVWRDERKLGGGDSFSDEIKQALSSTGI